MGQSTFQFPTRIRCTRERDPWFQESKLIDHPAPVYPPEAIVSGIEGEVVLDVVVGHGGEILSLSVQSGHPVLAEAALGAVRQWKWHGTKLNGRPVEVLTDVHVTFTLPGTVVSA